MIQHRIPMERLTNLLHQIDNEIVNMPLCGQISKFEKLKEKAFHHSDTAHEYEILVNYIQEKISIDKTV